MVARFELKKDEIGKEEGARYVMRIHAQFKQFYDGYESLEDFDHKAETVQEKLEELDWGVATSALPPRHGIFGLLPFLLDPPQVC
ncbi:hypothetical protein RB195_004817 [Necator americanus]|uniref:Uncharacterized protein n=1 Tax=Necator americanus TaxID=51031 RepID=A0ABR1BJS9_NECAM